MRPIKIDLHTYDKGKGHLSIKEQNILRAIVFKCSTPIICYNLTFHPNELDLFILYFLFAILQSGKVLKQFISSTWKGLAVFSSIVILPYLYESVLSVYTPH